MLLLMDPGSFYGISFHEWAGLAIGLFFILHNAWIVIFVTIKENQSVLSVFCATFLTGVAKQSTY